MSDVNGFIDALGRDVTNTVVPRIEMFADGFRNKTLTEYGPRVSAFANQLVTDILNEQSATFREFVTTLLQDLFQRYRPELVGEVHATVVPDGLQLTGQQIRLDLQRRDTGASVSSLDLPMSIKIKVPALAVNLRDSTITLDVVR
jgi:hypothetical protein